MTFKIVLGMIASLLFAVFVFGAIASKAGYPKWYGLAMAVPFINIVAIFFFAFSTWPIEDELLQARFDISQRPTQTL